jgi:hypothetical protein
LSGSLAYAQSGSEQAVFKAMTDEMRRSTDSLHLAGWERPFFIQYAVQKGRIFQVQATMGALTGVNEFPLGCMSVQTLAGTYRMSDINHTSSDYRSGSGRDAAPLDDNYGEIRRRLWLLTDQTYKRAIEAYSAKMTAVKRQNLPEEVRDLPDFTPLPATVYRDENTETDSNGEYWKQLARRCSSVFGNYPDIYGSNVGIEVYSGNVYSLNSEGTRLTHPVRMIAIAVNAYTKSADGEEISDRLTYYGWVREDMPSAERLSEETDRMAANLMALAGAPAMEESYTGPVMLEGAALSSAMVSGLLAAQTGLVAYRTPIRSGGGQKSMEDRINRKVLSSDITVKSVPSWKEYDGQRLIGSYDMDAEGVAPAGELLLIENGMLRTLMCDRVPKKKIRTPTGHRIYAYLPQDISTSVSPGVLSIRTSQGYAGDVLKNMLLEAAGAEGLEYAYIIRSLPNGRYASLYKVLVADGSEQPVRAGNISHIGLPALKRALGASAEVEVSNMIAGNVPLSVICPGAMIIEEIDIEKRNLQNTTKLPTVRNPLRRHEQQR